MLKHVAAVLFVAMLLVSTGCNPGSNRFSKAGICDHVVEITQFFSNRVKELK